MHISVYLVILFLSLIISIVFGIISHSKPHLEKSCGFICFIGIVATIFMITTIIVNQGSSNKQAKAIVEENYELNLYYEAVNNSHNEYIRYDFYERVKNHNKDYENYIKKSENPFYAPFYNIEDLEGCYPVPFTLRNEDYFVKNTQG